MPKFKPLTAIAVTALALTTALGITAPVFADEATTTSSDVTPSVWIQISPVSNRVSLQPGQALEYTFNIENNGTESFDFHTYAAPYSVVNESYELSFSTQTERTQISRWITFKDESGKFTDEPHFHLDAGSKKTITYRIAVPENIPAGGQYATIFAESDSKSTNEAGIQTVSRVGLVIYGSTHGDTEEKAEITNFSLSSFLTSGEVTTAATIKNDGNTDFAASNTLIVKNLFGDVKYERTMPYDVLPGTSRRITSSWEDTPMFGIFHVTSTTTALDQKVDSSKIVIIIPLFVLIIAILLLTLLVIWIIILIRKRHEQKSKIIV